MDEQKVQDLEDEFKILKNEIQESLIDIREHLLTYLENPFAGNRQDAQIEVVGMHHKVVIQEEPASASQLIVRPEPNATTMPEQSAPSSKLMPDMTTPAPTSPDLSGNGLANQSAVVPPAVVPQQQPGALGVAPPATIVNQVSVLPPQEFPTPPGLPPETVSKNQEHEGTGSSNPKNTNIATGESENQGHYHCDPNSSGLEEKENSPVPFGTSEWRASASRKQERPEGLMTVFTLSAWLEDGIRRVGRKRMKTIIEIYTSTEEMSSQVKEALLQMINMDGRTDGARGKVAMRECLGILAELDGLLWQTRFAPSRAALLSMFLSREEPQT